MDESLWPDNLHSPIFEAFTKSVDRQYIYICDVKSNIWRWSPSSVKYFGLPGEIIPDLPDYWMKQVHPDDREQVAQEFNKLFSGVSETHSCEYRVKNSEGQYVWVLCKGCMVRDDNGQLNLCAGILTDLGQKSKFDSVTGLCSLYEFHSAMSAITAEPGAKGGVLLVGIDYFRRINETHQYSFGNALLASFAKKLNRLAPKGSGLYRMDGDKFALIYPDALPQDIESLFQSIQQIGTSGLYIQDQMIPFTLSGGAILYPKHGLQADILYSSLEYALESSKRYNREGLTFFTEHLHEAVLFRFQLQQKLRESIRNGFEGFYLCYQPIISADDSSRLTGAEALLRWYHPDFGNIPPTEFIPLLEESGDISSVGKWVLSMALGQVKKWQAIKPELRISINVSALQLREPDFKYFVLDEVEKFSFPKKQLILELTESCNVIHPEEVEKDLAFFRQNGIQIALDDFGTGYASLSILRDLTADWIKVDHTFVSQIADSHFDQALTESLISLCKKLGLNVCVEGVETKEIENVIQKYNPTVLQGYYYSRPIETKLFELQYILK